MSNPLEPETVGFYAALISDNVDTVLSMALEHGVDPETISAAYAKLADEWGDIRERSTAGYLANRNPL